MSASMLQLIIFIYKRDTSILSTTMIEFMFLLDQWIMKFYNEFIYNIQYYLLCTGWWFTSIRDTKNISENNISIFHFLKVDWWQYTMELYLTWNVASFCRLMFSVNYIAENNMCTTMLVYFLLFRQFSHDRKICGLFCWDWTFELLF